MGWEVTRTEDTALVGAVLFDPDIYDRITDDDSPPPESFVIPECEYWLGLVDEKPASLLPIHDNKIHYMVRKPYRPMARVLLEASIQQSGYQWLYCEIPTLYQDTINFARNSGFKDIGATGGTHRKNGRTYSIRRLEIEV